MTRLTPEQRDHVLGLAAQLQARHDSTTDVDELARIAGEAGIDPRFVHEAAERVVRPTAVEAAPSLGTDWPALGFGLLAVAAVGFTLSPFRMGNPVLSFAATFLAVGLFFAVGIAVGRRRGSLWALPATTLLVLAALTHATFGVRLVGDPDLFRIAFALSSGLFGAVSVLAGVAVARVPRERR